MLAQTRDLTQSRQLPHDLTVIGDIQLMLILEGRQNDESCRCVVIACAELRNDLLLHYDPLNTGFNILQDQCQLLLKNNAPRLR
jgi:hypothetical protein